MKLWVFFLLLIGIVALFADEGDAAPRHKNKCWKRMKRVGKVLGKVVDTAGVILDANELWNNIHNITVEESTDVTCGSLDRGMIKQARDKDNKNSAQLSVTTTTSQGSKSHSCLTSATRPFNTTI